MKLYNRFLTAFLALAVGMTACGPQEEVKPELGEAPKPGEVTFTYKVDEENPNIIHFTNTSEVGFKAIWDFDNGVNKVEGDQVSGEFALKGEYEVKMTLYSRGGSTAKMEKITIENTNALMLDREDYNLLTGGVDALDGKNWVVDKTMFGHMGVGPVETLTPDWWQAPPMDKEGLGMYDDVYTFKLDGFGFKYESNGDIFVNGGHVEKFGGDPAGGDQKIAFSYPDAMTWSMTEDADGRKFMTLSNESHIGFYAGTNTYEILKLEENELYIRFLDGNGGLAWYHRLIPEGYEHPVEELEYTAKDLFDDFEGNQAEALVWFSDEVADFAAGYDNPATFGANTSEHVAKYVKGDGEANMWNNLQAQLGYKIDLTARNKFKLKVFLPAYNDYTTESAPDWWNVYRKLTPMIALKLQNSELGGDAYTTQAEVKFENLELGVWHELEFDFSEHADRTDFDKLIIQIGGEGHYIPGTFFFDDFELL